MPSRPVAPEPLAAVVSRPAVALPRHVATRDTIKETIRRVLGDAFPRRATLERIVDNSGILRRHLVRSLEETLVVEGFGARNDVYARESRELASRAAVGALANAGLGAEDIDLVVTTSCTGLVIPSVCAYLLPALGFRPSTKRLPITELGCAAGAVALSRAREFVQCYPGRNVLVIAHELCSLTYQPGDRSMQALVGALLFADGAAACVVRGDGAGPGLRLDVNASHLFADSAGYMGFDVRDTGLHLVLDKAIPGAVERQIAPVVRGFLAAHDTPRSALGFFGLHPGGRKLIDALAEALALAETDVRATRDCLAEVGNLSSASILVVLRNLFERYTPAHGARGLLAAFGPGFSAELLLGTWVGHA